jgi:hypothetical protein
MKKSLGFCLFLLSPVLFAQATVTAILPESGVTTGGDFVHIRGDGLYNPRVCSGPSPCPASVKFGDASARVLSNTSREIVVIAPPHASGTVDVTASVPGFSPVVLANAYRYQNRSNAEWERVLLPVAASGPGPNGARFETEILITNAGDEAVPIGGAAIPCCSTGQSPPPLRLIQPHTTSTFTPGFYLAEAYTGAFITVPSRMARDVITKVRVHDTSRDASSFGVEIPVVSDLDFAATVRLEGIPTDARFRSTLRVYAYDARNFGPVTLRVRDAADGTLLATVPVALNSPNLQTEASDLFPTAAQLSLDSIIAPLRSHPRLRIDIADSDAIRPIWAFVSITNNETQEITLVTPQPSGAAVTPEKIPLGWWKSSAGSLIFAGEAVSSVYLGCRFGTFNTPPSLDSDGRFKTTGLLSGPGPDQIGQPPLIFEGRIADGWLNLTIRSDSAVVTTTQFQFAGPQQPGPLPVVCP